MKRFLDQELLGESLDEFRSEVQAAVFTLSCALLCSL